jgi:hypothetical protein
LWTEKEIETLKRLYPKMGYAAISKRLKRRSYWSVRHKAQQLGLTPHRHVWTGAEIARLRKVYRSGTVAEIRAEFPCFTLSHIRSIAHFHGIFRDRHPFKRTGYLAVDQIRERAFDLGYSMPDVDQLARTKKYFQTAAWHCGHVNYRAIGRAIDALDGKIAVEWSSE